MTFPKTLISCATTWARCAAYCCCQHHLTKCCCVSACRALSMRGNYLPMGTNYFCHWQYECRLCLTLHNNEGNYLAHTQVRTVHFLVLMQLETLPCMLNRRAVECDRANHVFLAQGKRHQQNLAKRAAREAAEKPILPQPNRRASVKKTGALSHFGASCHLPDPLVAFSAPHLSIYQGRGARSL